MSRIKSITMLVAAFGLVAALAYAQGGSTPASAPAAKSTAMSSKGAAHKATAAPKIDLNSADKEQLEKIPGVDEATADKIVAARPFKSRSELVSKGILTKAQYSKAMSKVTVKAAAK